MLSSKEKIIMLWGTNDFSQRVTKDFLINQERDKSCLKKLKKNLFLKKFHFLVFDQINKHFPSNNWLSCYGSRVVQTLTNFLKMLFHESFSII